MFVARRIRARRDLARLLAALLFVGMLALTSLPLTFHVGSVAVAPASASRVRPISMLWTAWQQDALSKVVSTLGLTEKDYAAEFGYDGKVSSYEGQGAPNVAWCSGLLLPGELASVAAFCGPLTDVPHLVCAAGYDKQTDEINVYIDYRPRADAAYDPQCATLEDYLACASEEGALELEELPRAAQPAAGWMGRALGPR